MASCVVTVEPLIEPVSLSTAKLHCKIDNDDDDTLVSALITTSRRWCESRLSQQLITATRKLRLDGLPCHEIVLPYSPILAVSSIEYVDIAGATQTWSDTLYDVDINTRPGRIRPKWGQFWPSVRHQMNAVTITYTCGYGATAASVPTPIRQAMLLLIGHLYENRESTAEAALKEIPHGVESLLMAEWHGEVQFAGGAQ